MSRATLSAIENGTVPEIGIRKILALCDALGLELISQQKSKRPTLQQLIRENNNT
jgi:transcriptional regulator with XRE-family HTH domain